MDAWIWKPSAGQCIFETRNPCINVSTSSRVISGLFCGKEIMSGSSTRVLVLIKSLVSLIMVLYHGYILISFLKGPTH